MGKRKRLYSNKKEEEEGEESSPVRAIFCLKSKNKLELERFDKEEDCYLLDFDPFHSINKLNSADQQHCDISIVAEKGQLACRDYPHARYLCSKYPIHKTPIHSYCHMCYCYVCDALAPCPHWTIHSSASHTNSVWRQLRRENFSHSRSHANRIH